MWRPEMLCRCGNNSSSVVQHSTVSDLATEADDLWAAIVRDAPFSHIAAEACALKDLSLKVVRKWFATHISAASRRRREILVLVQGGAPPRGDVVSGTSAMHFLSAPHTLGMHSSLHGGVHVHTNHTTHGGDKGKGKGKGLHRGVPIRPAPPVHAADADAARAWHERGANVEQVVEEREGEGAPDGAFEIHDVRAWHCGLTTWRAPL
jgi:hypothetical protein